MARLYMGNVPLSPAIYKNDTVIPTATKNINANGTYSVTDYATAIVAVPNQTQTIAIETNGIYYPTSPNIGFNEVVVAIPMPSGSMNITRNGTYDVYYTSTVNVNVPIYIDREVVEGKLVMPATNFSKTYDNITDLGDSVLYSAFYACSTLTSVSFPALTKITSDFSLGYTFRECENLTSVNLGVLQKIQGNYAMFNAFLDCSRLATINLGELKEISGDFACGYMFQNCRAITTYTFTKLDTLTGSYALMYAFQRSGIRTLYFPALKASSFGTHTNQFNGMLSGLNGVTVHFPSTVRTTMRNWSDVLAGFGGINTQILWDL